MVKTALLLGKTARLLAASGTAGGLAWFGTQSDRATNRKLRKYDVDFLDGDLIYGMSRCSRLLTSKVPGFKGSHLYDPDTGKVEYLPFQMLVNAKKPNLRLKLDPEEPTLTEKMAQSERLQPFAVITRIGNAVDLCHRFFRLMKKRQEDVDNPRSFRFHSFPYDFRRDNVTSAMLLEEKLQQIYDNNGQKPVTVVAHSMGGLLALHVLNRRPELIRACVFVGSPFRSLRGILKVLNTGDTMLLNSDSVSQYVQFTWPSGYAMLCMNGRGVFLDEKTNKMVDLDLWNPETWIKMRLTSSIRKAIEEEGEKGAAEMRKYMTRVLSKAQEFNATMRKHDPTIPYPPISIVTAKNRTLGWAWKAKFKDDGSLDSVDWDKPIQTVEADGTCPTFSMRPPEGVPVIAEFETEYLHRSMVNDLDAVVSALRTVYHELDSHDARVLPGIRDKLSPDEVSHMHDATLGNILEQPMSNKA